jgi:maltooligosyltrehalose trehalohydrolase
MTDGGWGTSLLSGGGARFRIWAPGETSLALRIDGAERPMEPAGDGWFELVSAEARAGSEYAFVTADGRSVPDPASRAQAGDVNGPSLIVDPRSYRWRDAGWRGRPWEEAVICEAHVGTFTSEGTFRAMIDRLDHLAETGFTALELMPVAQFSGNRGWGYDGVLLYAPHRAYGSPDDLRSLVDAAHARGLMVLLDVVYNHFGPEGNHLPSYAPGFFDRGRQTPWGAAIAFEKAPVRGFFVQNALYWLEEFRFDGFRFDAVDQVRDPGSEPEILVEIAERIRATDFGRPVHLLTEDNRNITRLHERDPDGAVALYTAEWNDDFHNAAHVIATGETEGYYVDFASDTVAGLSRALAQGYVFQGDRTASGETRGVPSGHLPPTAFVDFLQNHDQTGNRAFGERLIALTPEPRLRALMAILLLSPHVPMLFMGEEWGETRPFAFFTDFDGDLADAVREGRRREFREFAEFKDPDRRALIPDPNAPTTFAASKIDWDRRDGAEGRAWLDFTSGLLEIRRRAIVPRLARTGGDCGRIVASGEGIVVVDWSLDGADLRLRANLGASTVRVPAARGEILYSTTADESEDTLPPDGVSVTLEAKGRRP